MGKDEEKRMVPKIRFPGFTDNWEQRKLSELVTKYEDPVETPHDGYTRLGIRSHAKGTFHEYVEPGHELETAKMHRVAANKLIFNITFAWEHAVAITDENDAGKLVSHRFPQFSLSNSLRPEFLKYVILDENFHHHLYLSSPGGAGRNRVLKIDEALNYPIYFPSVEEQHKIGEFLNQLTDLITLHQRKLDDLKALKKGLLQRMFPKDGQLVPEIRFPGFTDDWEQRKLSDLSEMITVGIANSATQAYSSNGIIMFRNQNIKPNLLDDSELIHINPDFEKRYIGKRLKKNDILVARTGYPGTACVIPEKYENSQTFTTLILRLKAGINPYYVCQYLNSPLGKSYFEATQIGGGQKNSGAGILEQFPLQLPSNVAEQNMIACFLKKFDTLITLHQRKLNDLKELKKGLLQQMFI